MQFFMQYIPDSSAPPDPQHMEKMNAFIEEQTNAGVLVSTGAFKAGTTRVRLKAGDITVTDGPFAETKEVVIGWAIVNAESKEDAIDQAKRFLAVAGDGQSEIREIYEPEK